MPIDTDQLRRSVDLPALIGRHVKLRRHHDYWSGLCPFHAEKTPSFYVYPDSYHCFGCGAHGDCLAWVMRADGVEFIEAARRLGAEEIDGRELRKREREREQERRAVARAWADANPWADLKRRWDREQASRWRAEIAWMAAWRETADFHYLTAEAEREAV